jgi:hypothetical protein
MIAMTDTDRTPPLAELEAAARPYEHIRAITDPALRATTAQQALLALVPPESRRAAEHLAHTIDQAGQMAGEAFMRGELDAVARHFPGLELAILAVYDHVRESASGPRHCSCPAGEPRRCGGVPDAAA